MNHPTIDVPPGAPLNRGIDRCDRCGAEAFVRTTINGVDLHWCGHHFAKHETALRAAAVLVHDERSRINEKPSTSANV